MKSAAKQEVIFVDELLERARGKLYGRHERPYKRGEPKVGRNDQCPCGSGLKYKKCHGKIEQST